VTSRAFAMPFTLVRKILFTWLFLNIVWLMASSLPHAPVHFLSWANHSLYSLLLLLAVAIARHDTYKRPVFISLALYFFFHIISIVPIFTGKNYLFGTNTQCILFWLYAQIPVRVFGSLTVFFLVIHYSVPTRWRRTGNIILILATLAAAIVLFQPFWSTTTCINQAGWINTFFKRILPFSVLPLLALGYYAFRIVRHNRPDAIYLNLLAIQFFIIHFLNVADFIAYTSRIHVYGIDQYFLLGCLFALIAILFLRLGALFSEEERYYERLIFDPVYLSRVPVLFYDRTLLRWWPLLRGLLNRSLAIHLLAGLVFLALALAAGSLYTTVKLSFLVFWIGLLIVLVDQKYTKSQAGTVLNNTKMHDSMTSSDKNIGASPAAP
jgi:hypothetical protein